MPVEPTMSNPSPLKPAIFWWLIATAAMIFLMAVIGAVTRLTESGLSMVEWRPLIGALPPLNEAEWQRVFSLYQQSPEFQKVNAWMDLAEFKKIFFWEWLHRLWGRAIGLVFAIPLIYFIVRKHLSGDLIWKAIALFILGGSQGVLGWYMVQSGLVDRPSVSHFRLAAHLSLAFVLYGLTVSLAVTVYQRLKNMPAQTLFKPGLITLALVTITVIWGAFVAGLDGGLIYNEWPQMGGQFMPDEVASFENVLNHPVGVQFLHRWLAALTLIAVIGHAWIRQNPALGFVVFCQFGFGLATLLSQVWIPLAALHQAGALILITLLILDLRGVIFFKKKEPVEDLAY